MLEWGGAGLHRGAGQVQEVDGRALERPARLVARLEKCRLRRSAEKMIGLSPSRPAKGFTLRICV